MQAVLDLLRLNGYGVYVWPAFAFAAIVLAAMGWRILTGLRRAEAELAAIEARAATKAADKADRR
ncbi:MAG: hypothetical protein RL477_649 [Pseudomonadota bacterium]|jgi:heme exporter protein CcmD